MKQAVQRIEGKDYVFSPYIDYDVVKTNKWDKAIITLPDGTTMNGLGQKNGKYTSQGIKSAWLLECPEFASFDQKFISRMQNIDNLNESVDLLNSKKCFRLS